MTRRMWGIFALFLALRITLAFTLPVFNDEAIFMRWGLGVRETPARWFMFMHDGKQPLVPVVFGLAQILPVDPLLSARAVSILFSTVTFWFSLQILRRFFPKTDPTIPMVLVACCPFLVFFDTLAIAESAITAAFTWLLYLTLIFIQKPGLRKGLLIGTVIGVGWWFKLTIFLAIPCIVITLLLCFGIWKKRWTTLTGGVAGAILAASLIIVPFRFNPSIDYQAYQPVTRILSVGTILTFPVSSWWQAIQLFTWWMLAYAGPLLCIAAILAVWKFRMKRDVWVLVLWFLIPLVAEIIGLTTLSARFIVFACLPLVLVAGIWLSQVQYTLIPYVVMCTTALLACILAVSPVLYYRILQPIPGAQRDFGQYVTGWTSGWGVDEAADTLIDLAKFQPIVVFVKLYGGNPEEAMPPYLSRHQIPVFQLFEMPTIAKIPEFAKRPWYFVSRGALYEGLDPYLEEIARFNKPLDPDFVGVYRINHK